MRRIIAHKLKWDDEGVASTVGTIMALLVFLTFMSMIVNSYVPVWMKDSESSHMNVAYGQFGSMKQGIDTQILYAHFAEVAGEPFTATTTFSPITLGVDGIPIFSAPSLGELIADQTKGPWNAWFSYYPSKYNNTSALVNESAMGQISLTTYNRYFVQQSLVYENGAVIKGQYDGMVMRAEPTFDVKIVNNTEDITIVLISLLGYGSLQGTTTEGIHSKVISASQEKYERVYTWVNISHISPYGLAWYAFYNASLTKAFGITADRYSPGTCSDANGYCYTLTRGGPYGVLTQMIRSPFFKLDLRLNETTKDYRLVVTLKNDYNNRVPSMMPIRALRIYTAVVNLAVGGLGARVNI